MDTELTQLIKKKINNIGFFPVLQAILSFLAELKAGISEILNYSLGRIINKMFPR